MGSAKPKITGSAADFIPKRVTLKALKAAAAHCHGCPLFLRATQTVFGEGPKQAALMLVGEQPGDQEDRTGKPFVGPAGRLLNVALETARIDRAAVYVTNAVKHFKWEPRGKRRIHSKPSTKEVMACKPWLLEEIRVVAPRIIVCLGATAAQALLGRNFKLTHHRGKFIHSGLPDVEFGGVLLATVHPSSLLRIPDREARHAAEKAFNADFVRVAKQLRKK